MRLQVPNLLAERTPGRPRQEHQVAGPRVLPAQPVQRQKGRRRAIPSRLLRRRRFDCVTSYVAEPVLVLFRYEARGVGAAADSEGGHDGLPVAGADAAPSRVKEAAAAAPAVIKFSRKNCKVRKIIMKVQISFYFVSESKLVWSCIIFGLL